MFESYRPDYAYRRVYDIDAARLRADGISALILDLDNTVCRFNKYDIEPRTAEWIGDWIKSGGRAVLCSNNHPPRVKPVADALGIKFLADAHKPRAEAYLSACAVIGAQPQNTAEVGDQLITDVHGARRAGLRAVLVNPIGGREFIGTYLNRAAEKIIMLVGRIGRA